MTGMTIIFFTLVFSGILNIVYFSKKHLNSHETKLFSTMLLINLGGLVLELICSMLGNYFGTSNLYALTFTRLYLIYLLLFLYLISIYICLTCFLPNNEKKFNAFKIFYLVVFIVSVILDMYLPLTTEKGYAVGKAIDFIFISSVFHIAINSIVILKNIKQVNSKKFIPFLCFLFFSVIVGMIQKAHPEYTLITCMEFLVLFIMYFTIENPDLKMIEELTKAKKLSEVTNDEKSQFLFEVTEDIQNTLNEANDVAENISRLNPTDEIKEEVINLKNIINVARIKVKNTIDVSEMDAKYLKNINSKYNVNLLLESISTMFSQKSTEDVEFRSNVVPGLPKGLYGDSVKIKQIISTILTNAFKYTKHGFVELRVNYINKYDVCRLIISVEDSGEGMDLHKQNEILNNHSNMTDEEISNIDNMNLNLKMVRKIVNLIGGSFTIESKPNMGTRIKVILDQKIALGEETKEEEKITKYEETYNSKKKVALICSNIYVKEFKKIIKKGNVVLDYYDVTKNCLDKIRNKEKYDLILIEEKMEKIDAITFLNKTKEIEGFKSDIVVLSSLTDIKAKKNLFDFGFDGIMKLPADKKEVKEKIDSLFEKDSNK